MDIQISNRRDVGAQAEPTDPAGLNLAIVLEEATTLEEPEETLVADPRGNLTPSQTVDLRLARVVQTSRPGPLSRWHEGASLHAGN